MGVTRYDKSDRSTRAYDWGIGQKVAIGTASAQSASIDAVEVMLRPSSRCFIAVGANPAAANAAGSVPLEAGESFHLQLASGDKVAVIQDTAAGFLYIMPVA